MSQRDKTFTVCNQPQTTNLQEAGLQSKSYFCKAFACCRDSVQLKYVKSWTIMSCSSFCHYTVRYLFFIWHVLGLGFFFQYAFANEWVVWVNFWLGLAYHTEETSSYTHTGKIQTRSSDVSLHVHQEESGITSIVPFCSFFPSGFIHWSDRYLGNTSCLYCIFGHRGRNTRV